MNGFPVRPDVRSFLEQLSAAGRDLDAETQRHCWAETFLSLDPVRAVPVTPEALLEALPRRRELFESIGATESELVDATETPLDDRHTIVRTSWRWNLPSSPDRDDELVLSSTYLLRREDTGWTILVYLNHQNVAALIAARALRKEA